MKQCKVKRIKHACCGMVDDEIYNGVTRTGHYVSVQLPDGTWTGDHWAPGYFEFIEPLEIKEYMEKTYETK